jgi:large subunit ribosomal protein L23
MSERIYHVLDKPYVSEKMSTQKGDKQVLGFAVRKDANKFEIKAAVEEMLDVKVESVRTVSSKPQKVRFGNSQGTTKATKKAYVTLQAGETVEQTGGA